MVSLASHDVQKGKQIDRTAPSRRGLFSEIGKTRCRPPQGVSGPEGTINKRLKSSPRRNRTAPSPPRSGGPGVRAVLTISPTYFQIPLVRFQCSGGREAGPRCGPWSSVQAAIYIYMHYGEASEPLPPTLSATYLVPQAGSSRTQSTAEEQRSANIARCGLLLRSSEWKLFDLLLI